MIQRRVGTLTFGLLMIVLGILYLLITVFNIHIEEYILKFWPIILISLGIETLTLNKLSIKNNIELKYDLLSFFLIIIMIFFCFSIYTANKLIYYIPYLKSALTIGGYI